MYDVSVGQIRRHRSDIVHTVCIWCACTCRCEDWATRLRKKRREEAKAEANKKSLPSPPPPKKPVRLYEEARARASHTILYACLQACAHVRTCT